MSLRDDQISRVKAALKDLATLRDYVDSAFNIDRKSSVELLDTAKTRLQPFLGRLADAGPELTPDLNRDTNGALSYAKAAIETVEKYGVRGVVSESLKAWTEDPVGSLKQVGTAIGEGAGAVLNTGGDIIGAIIAALVKALKGPIVILLLGLLLVVGVIYFIKKKGG